MREAGATVVGRYSISFRESTMVASSAKSEVAVLPDLFQGNIDSGFYAMLKRIGESCAAESVSLKVQSGGEVHVVQSQVDSGNHDGVRNQ